MEKLPPKALTQALLARVLRDGIGRLYFERGETTGRILWSKDGIVQAALEELSLPLFQSVINELKRLTHLPMVNTRKSRQVEIERTYRQERVVLRFRLIASDHGEEATLQVLRGAALKFYQQQQIDQLGRDALNFAHRLQGQIDQIRDRARQTFTLEGVPETTLTTISHLLRDIDTEINQLINQHQKR
jgi:type II secretory ATPase GspE/PulE/Tfp pilus assembly ATPase PilB-like protein